MSTHTPGPWTTAFHVRNQRTGTGDWVFFPEGHTFPLLRKGQRSEADARLIAAAPEMLEALHCCIHGSKDWMEKAKAAYAKATGES